MSLELYFRFLDGFKRAEQCFILVINHMSDVQITRYSSFSPWSRDS